jgi:hypothetical protein
MHGPTATMLRVNDKLAQDRIPVRSWWSAVYPQRMTLPEGTAASKKSSLK